MARIPVVPKGWRGDGIVAGLGEWDAPVEFVRRARADGIPVVDIYRMRPEIRLPRVVGDHLTVGRQAAEHLRERGWRRFAWFSRVDHAVAQLRLQGFRAALGRAEVIILAPGVTLERSVKAWDKSRQTLARSLREAASGGPLGVMAFNDYDAALIEESALDAGLKVPADVGIVGVDDNPLVVECAPVPLSSVRLDLERIGYEGAAMLARLMDGHRLDMAPQLVAPRGVAERASTAGVPASHPALRLALDHMAAHLGQPLAVEEIARVAGQGRRTLEQLFRTELGTTVHRQLVVLRLRAACERLAATSEPVERIARDCGFAHGPHFHAVFRRLHGCSPRAWRLRAREQALP
jgi:LacI family transcriptional regulator